MAHTDLAQPARINMKIFHRIELCQKCKQPKLNTELWHLTLGKRLKGICYQCYEKIKSNALEWENFMR